MSQQIDTALVNQYRSNIEIQFQQKLSRLQPTVDQESQNAEYDYYDRIGPVTAQEIPTRHADTQYTDTPHTRRRNQTKPYYFADLIDKRDKLRMLADPTSSYVQNAVMALNRKMDKIIIDSAKATAYAGKEGGTAVSFPAGQTIAEDYVESGGAANSNLTIAKLRRARYLLTKEEAIDDGEEVTCVVTASQMDALLRTTEVTSADYNTVKALVNGTINSFMGFNFVRTELLDIDGSSLRSVLCYPRSAIKMGVAENVTTEVDRLPGKHYSVQIYVSMDIGAVRMWEEKVVEILCDES